MYGKILDSIFVHVRLPMELFGETGYMYGEIMDSGETGYVRQNYAFQICPCHMWGSVEHA